MTAGSTTILTCVGFGNPTPYITWRRGATELSNGSRTTIYEELVTENGVRFVQSILEICSVGEADDGQYSCTVGNALGNASVNFELSVTGAGGKCDFHVHDNVVIIACHICACINYTFLWK